MRITLIVAALVLTMPYADAQIGRRDRIEHRFENDIRANKDAMSRRFSGPSNRIETQNARLRERLNAKRSSGVLRGRR
jgi:hypothetical protein